MDCFSAGCLGKLDDCLLIKIGLSRGCAWEVVNLIRQARVQGLLIRIGCDCDARDRDKPREFVLRGLGWEIVRIWSTDWWIDTASTAEKVHQKLSALLATSRAKQAEIDAAEEVGRLKADAAVAEVIEVVEQVSQVVTGEEGMPVANDPAGAFQEQKYAKVATIDAVPKYVAYEPVDYPIYRETDPAQAVEGVYPDQFFEAAYTPVLQSMIAHVVNEEGPVLDSVLARRIARAHGWVRTGARIRDRVDQLARAHFRAHEEEQMGTFFWPASLESDAPAEFRRPGDDDSIRSLAEICLQELSALVGEMEAKGHQAETLVHAVAKEAGVTKLAHAGRLRIEKAIRLRGEA
ncbi:DUF3320 domain-containing protein [Pseudomonas putida]|nr:DUF3320 domain-containing protein [Pseudomonas putida]MBH3459263.1 DUF3320 domain-containing protein [Pseudomonas putida]